MCRIEVWRRLDDQASAVMIRFPNGKVFQLDMMALGLHKDQGRALLLDQDMQWETLARFHAEQFTKARPKMQTLTAAVKRHDAFLEDVTRPSDAPDLSPDALGPSAPTLRVRDNSHKSDD